MKFKSIVLVLFLLSTTRLWSMTAAEAKNHIGENATVCGAVASEHTAMQSRGTPTFINLDEPYPRELFTILVWGESRTAVDPLPQMGDHLCVTGVIRDYRGTPEMVVRSKVQINRR